MELSQGLLKTNKWILKVEDNTDIWDISRLGNMITSLHFPSMPSQLSIKIKVVKGATYIWITISLSYGKGGLWINYIKFIHFSYIHKVLCIQSPCCRRDCTRIKFFLQATRKFKEHIPVYFGQTFQLYWLLTAQATPWLSNFVFVCKYLDCFHLNNSTPYN